MPSYQRVASMDQSLPDRLVCILCAGKRREGPRPTTLVVSFVVTHRALYGTADDQVLTLYNEKPSALGHDFLLLTNPGLRATYEGTQFLVMARLRKSWEFSVDFTAGKTAARTGPGNTPFQDDTGFVGTLGINPNTLVMSQGRTYFDRGYMGKVTAYYAAPHGFYLAAVATYFDGAPFARLLFVNGFNQGPFFVRATPVGHLGGFQTELNATVEMRLARDFRLPQGTLSAYFDVFNIMNWNSNTGIGPHRPGLHPASAALRRSATHSSHRSGVALLARGRLR